MLGFEIVESSSVSVGGEKAPTRATELATEFARGISY